MVKNSFVVMHLHVLLDTLKKLYRFSLEKLDPASACVDLLIICAPCKSNTNYLDKL